LHEALGDDDRRDGAERPAVGSPELGETMPLFGPLAGRLSDPGQHQEGRGGEHHAGRDEDMPKGEEADQDAADQGSEAATEGQP